MAEIWQFNSSKPIELIGKVKGVVARTGLEPATSALKGRHPNH